MTTVEITTNTFTDGTLGGQGVYDIMVRTNREHLKREYDAGRITGDNFTNAYIALMQASMANATQYALTKDRIGYEIENLIKQSAILEEQLNTQLAQTAEIAAQTEITLQQKLNLQLEALNIPKQGIILDKQALNLDQDLLQSDAQTKFITEQTEVLNKTENFNVVR